MKLITSNNLLDYQQSLKQMNQLLNDKKSTCWLLEYQDVITDGSVGRGGGQIYHGPGQRVIYFIAPLQSLASDISTFINNLEDAIYQTCNYFNLQAFKRLDSPGVWIKNNNNYKKVAFIGLRINKDKWLSHGVAINLNVDLNKFDKINVCNKQYSVGNLEINMNTFDTILLEKLNLPII